MMADGWGDDSGSSSDEDAERPHHTIVRETRSESSPGEEVSNFEPPLDRDDIRGHSPLGGNDDLAAWIGGLDSLTNPGQSELFRLVILEWARRRRSDTPGGAPEKTDERTDTPLHEIARGWLGPWSDWGGGGVSFGARDLDEILSLFPDGLICRDGAGETPLHAALSCRKYEFAELVLSWFRPRRPMGEEVASIQNDYGCTPLHHAVRYRAPPKVLRRVAFLCPHAACLQNRLGFTPLHEAAREGSYSAAKEMLKRLTEQERREVICTQSKRHGDTALHLTQSASIFVKLVSMCPEAAIIKNEQGCTPFHYKASWTFGKKSATALQRACPEAASVKKVGNGQTPLHVMCNAIVSCPYNSLRGHVKEVLLTFRDMSPEVGLIQDDDGNTALHVEASFAGSLIPAEVVKTYLDIWPLAASISNEQGDTPLHVACAHVGLPTFDIVESLLRVHPESMEKPNKSGATPLHILFAPQTLDNYFHHKSKRMAGLLEKMLEATDFCKGRVNGRLVSGTLTEIGSIQDMSGNTPLHYAVSDFRGFVTTASMGAYMKAWSQAPSLANKDGDTPLHLACARTARSRPDLIALLLRTYPEASSRVNRLGQTPLHVLCSVRSMRKRRTMPLPATVSLLLEAYPEAATLSDEAGNIPLHCAFLTKADCATKARLLGECGEALGRKNANLQTVLHCACMTRANPKTLSSLIEAYPQAAEMADSFGNTPLHYTFIHKCSLSAKRLLFKAAKGALHVPNANMQRPIHLACKFRMSVEVLTLILIFSPNLATATDKEGNTPIHLAFLHHLSLDSKHMLLEVGSGAVRIANSRGQTPLSMSSSVNELFHLIRALPHLVRLY